MDWVLICVALAVIFYIYKRKERAKSSRLKRENHTDDISSPKEIHEPRVLRDDYRPTAVECIGEDGIPEFKYRFHAYLVFESTYSSISSHRAERFIKRPNGNRDSILEDGGIWIPVSEYDGSLDIWRSEDDQFKYVGGVKVYINLLLSVRSIYEDKKRTPEEKKKEIKAICLASNDLYTVKYSLATPWDSLLVPALSIGSGIGPHRLGLLKASGIETIDDIDSKTDDQLLDIKGIGKSAIADLRNLSSSWGYDRNTKVIERDEEFRVKIIS